MPQPIGEQVCVIVISPDAMKKTTAAAAGPMAAAQLCPDPMVKLTATNSLVGGSATINLTGTVCNSGAMEYNGKDSLDAFFMVYTWHPPKKAAQEHDLKDISHKPIGNKLTKGECKTVTQTFTISNVAAWNHVATQKPSRQAVQQFVFGVAPAGIRGAAPHRDDAP